MSIAILEHSRDSRLIKVHPTSILSRGKVRMVIGALIRNSPLQLVFSKRLKGKQYLNLGCGGNLLREFINFDYSWRMGQELSWDARKGIPLAAGTVQGIFTEHTLEHFTWEEAIKLVLPECFRILKPGGIIRIVVPDAELCLDRYQGQKVGGATASSFRAPFHGGKRIALTPMMEVNNTFRRIFEPLYVGHKFAYDFQTLEYFLHTVGFVRITKAAYMHGANPVLLVDTKRRAGESLYVEATRS